MAKTEETKKAATQKKEEKNTEEQKDSRFFVVRTFQKASDNISDTVKEYNDKYVKKVISQSREFSEDTWKEAKGRMDKVVETTKNRIQDTKIKKSIDKLVDESMNNVSKVFNLPNKNDIENLTVAMENLSAKVDMLNKKYTAIASAQK